VASRTRERWRRSGEQQLLLDPTTSWKLPRMLSVLAEGRDEGLAEPRDRALLVEVRLVARAGNRLRVRSVVRPQVERDAGASWGQVDPVVAAVVDQVDVNGRARPAAARSPAERSRLTAGRSTGDDAERVGGCPSGS